MLRTLLGKLRSSIPGRRQKQFLRTFPSIQHPKLYNRQKPPKWATYGDQARSGRRAVMASLAQLWESVKQLCWIYDLAAPVRFGRANQGQRESRGELQFHLSSIMTLPKQINKHTKNKQSKSSINNPK